MAGGLKTSTRTGTRSVRGSKRFDLRGLLPISASRSVVKTVISHSLFLHPGGASGANGLQHAFYFTEARRHLTNYG